MSLVFSPFVGFAIHGRVDDQGLAVGLGFAVLPLTGLAALAILRWRAWRRLPRSIVEEWTNGRVVPAAGAPPVTAPARFSERGHWIECTDDGVALRCSDVLAMHGISDNVTTLGAMRCSDECCIPWAAIVEWVVDTDSDGPDFYALILDDGGTVRIRRFIRNANTECALLDAVRSIGKRSVRLRCDID